jgi:oligopeptide/dipeptide ABC transporter ATP-binding protein
VSERVLEVRNLQTVFPGPAGPIPVVDDVSLHVERGEVLALVGESGCGKSMTAFSLLRLVPKPGRVARGTVHLDGHDVLALSIPELRAIRGREAAMIFQEPMTSLNPVQTAGVQVVEAIRLHEAVSRAAARRRTVELFERVGIPDPDARFDAYPHQLSGGMKQRVMIAMALSSQPKLLIADEPTTALDVTIQAQILELLRELQRETGMAILLITHDLGIVNELADRVAVMYAARLVEEGTREAILGRARHPYTRGLLSSMPALARRGEPLAEIPGTVPAPEDWPPGCRFSSRCARAIALCAAEPPDEFGVAEGHVLRCHVVKREETS